MTALTTEQREHTLIATLNRPESMNALSRALVDDLIELVANLSSPGEIRALILTGAGDRSFCAGADLKEREGMSDEEVHRFLDDLRRIADGLGALPIPAIAAINGYALGGGLELALACDFRIAAERASLGLTEVRLGIIPGAGGTQRLPRIIGEARARELIYTGRRLTAHDALDIGLVNSVALDETLIDVAYDFADEISQAAPLAIARAKSAITNGIHLPLSDALDVERAAYNTLLPSEDRREALTAFRERRTPRFTGK